MLWLIGVLGFFLLPLPLFLLALVLRLVSPSKHADVVAFFHPFCAGGGGGERVLWRAVSRLQRHTKDCRPVRMMIYTGDQASAQDIVASVQDKFGMNISLDGLTFVRLKLRWLLAASNYPRFTMLGQAFGEMLVGLEALTRVVPGVFIDSTGHAFTYPFARAMGCKVMAYTHYPTISLDMLHRVQARTSAHNNAAQVANSALLSSVKVLYYRVFAVCYGLAGRCCHVVMVNSSWTRRHIVSLWGRPDTTVVVYPPCDTLSLQQSSLHGRERVILSVGQFRPEKEHTKQLAAFRQLLRSGAKYSDVNLVLIGGARNEEDRERVARLKETAREWGIERNVQFLVNASWGELTAWFGRAAVGLHTMWNEHFGICCVEYMAAGVVCVAHRSGGPLCDIVDDNETGFLAETTDEYCECLKRALDGGGDTVQMREKARKKAAEKFSDQQFEERFIECMMSVW